MRIGAFSDKYNISIDTIRFYIKQKMLLPQKENSKYFFGASCEEDIKVILELKSFDFSIKEIRQMIFYIRLSKFEPRQTSKFLIKLLHDKINALDQEKIRIESTKNKIIKHLEDVSSEEIEQTIIGIPIDFIKEMKCQKCLKEYVLNSTSIKSNSVIEGSLSCSCGVLSIEDGIIIGQNAKEYPPESYLSVFSDYVKETDFNQFQTMYKTLEWIETKIEYNSLENKTVLDLGTGVGLFLRMIYNKIPQNTTIVCVDYNLSVLKFLKELLSYYNNGPKIVLISCDFKNIPLKSNTVSHVFDIGGRTNFLLHQTKFDKEITDTKLFESLNHLFKESTNYYGLHYIFEKFSVNHRYINSKQHHLFTENFVEEIFKQLEFKDQYAYKSERLPLGGQFEDFYVKEDHVHTLGLIAKKY